MAKDSRNDEAWNKQIIYMTEEIRKKVMIQMSDEDYKIAYENVIIANKMLEKENQKLVKAIDELEKYIKNKDYWVCELGYKEYTPYIKVQMILDKLTELKGEIDG